MAIFFQASPLAFFDDRVREPPPLAVEITEEQHAALLQDQANGRRIVAAANGTPTSATVTKAPQKVIQVTNYQARAILMQTNGPNGVPLFDTVNTMLFANKDSGPDGKRDWQAWEQANTFSRHGGLIARMAAQLNLTSAQVDALFLAASKIEA